MSKNLPIGVLVATPIDQSIEQPAKPPQLARARILFGELASCDLGRRGPLRDELVMMHLPLVKRIARRRSRAPDYETEELCQTGVIGLIKAIDRYDHSQRTPFAAFAVMYIDGEIKRFFRDTGWAVHVPRPMKDRSLLVTRTARRLAVSLGHEATTREIAKELNLKIEEVAQALIATHAWQARSLDLTAPKAATKTDRPDLAAEAAYQSVENSQLLEYAAQCLSEKEREVIYLRFGREMTQSQIGRMMGITQPQVSKIVSKCLQNMRARLE